MGQVVWNAVGQSSFKLGPDKFIRVKLWGISREGMGMDPAMAAQEAPNGRGSMNRTFVPQHHQRTPKVTQQVPKEMHYLIRSDVFMGMEAKVERHPLSLGRDPQGRDGRDFGPAARRGQDRGVALRCPSAGEGRDKQKSALIQEDQAGSKPFGLFLYGARRSVSNTEWRLRLVPGPFSRASDSSSPRPPSASKGWRWSSGCQSAGGLPRRFALASTDRWDSQRPKGRKPGWVSAFSFAAGSARKGVQGDAGAVILPVPVCGRLGASAPRKRGRPALAWPRSGSCDQLLVSEWPEAFAFPMFGVFHKVSCPIE